MKIAPEQQLALWYSVRGPEQSMMDRKRDAAHIAASIVL
jgi:hypothetical protein